MDENQKPFACTTDGCGQSFTNEDHLSVHRKKHTMQLQLSLGNKPTQFVADQTPTPTRLIRNCDEVGLFEDLHLQHVNPFDETFRRAVESKSQSTTPMNLRHAENIDTIVSDVGVDVGGGGGGGSDINDDGNGGRTSVEGLSSIGDVHSKTNQSSEETLHTPHVLPFHNNQFFKETRLLETLPIVIDNNNGGNNVKKTADDNIDAVSLESSSNDKRTINIASMVSDGCCPTILMSHKRSKLEIYNKHLEKNPLAEPTKRIKYMEQKILPKIDTDLQQQTLVTNNNTIALSNLIQVHFVTTSNTSHILPHLPAAVVSTTTTTGSSTTNNLPFLLPKKTPPPLAINSNNDCSNNINNSSVNSKLPNVREKLKQTILKNTHESIKVLPLNGIIIDSGKTLTDQLLSSPSFLSKYTNVCPTSQTQKEIIFRKLTTSSTTSTTKSGKNVTEKSTDSFERNKEAAKRYRNRMRQHHIETKESNIRLELENKKLKAEIKQLKKILLEHQNCTVVEGTKVLDQNFIGTSIELPQFVFKQLKNGNNVKTIDQLTVAATPVYKTMTSYSKSASSSTNANLDNLAAANPVYVIVNNKHIS